MATSPSMITGKPVVRSGHLTTSATTAVPPLNGYEGYEYYEPCTDFYDLSCFSFGFNFFTLEFAVIILLTPIHASMIVFLVLRGRSDKAFREAFYIQFLAVSVVDCVRMVYAIVDKLYWSSGTSLYGDAGVYSAFSSDFPWTPLYAQSMLHCLIAANRFTAFFYPLDHSSMWSRRVVGGSIAGIGLISVLLFAVPHYGVLAVPLSDDWSELNFWGFLRVSSYQVDSLLNSVVCLICAVVGFFLSIITLVKLRLVAKNGQANTRRDITLLFHSSLMISAQVLLAVFPTLRSTFHFINYFAPEETYVSPFWKVYFAAIDLSTVLPETLLTEVFSLMGTPLLFLLSKHVRIAYWDFYVRRSAHVNKVNTAKTHSNSVSNRNRLSGETKLSTLFTSRIK